MRRDDFAPDDGTPAARGLGALLQTQVEHVDLGEQDGRRLRARVEHRTLRLALGRARTAGVTLGRRRAVAVEVAFVPDEPGRTASEDAPPVPYDVAISLPPDPWAVTARRIAFVASACWVTTCVVRRLRNRRRDEGVPR
ncbi:MAG: hypothetical protein AB7F65_04905 [Dehalococcoidia bacterium]